MNQSSTETLWVGLDVHHKSITAAVFCGEDPEPMIHRLSGDLNATRRLCSGRALDHDRFRCEIIGPSLIHRKPGDRRKSDRLDAIHLARCYHAGQLAPVAMPDEQQEAARQLLLGRLAMQRHITRLKHRIVRVLATHGHRFTGGKSLWTQKHRVWLVARLR